MNTVEINISGRPGEKEMIAVEPAFTEAIVLVYAAMDSLPHAIKVQRDMADEYVESRTQYRKKKYEEAGSTLHDLMKTLEKYTTLDWMNDYIESCGYGSLSTQSSRTIHGWLDRKETNIMDACEKIRSGHYQIVPWGGLQQTVTWNLTNEAREILREMSVPATA